MSKKDATQDTQLQELRAEIAALKASMTKKYRYSYCKLVDNYLLIY